MCVRRWRRDRGAHRSPFPLSFSFFSSFLPSRSRLSECQSTAAQTCHSCHPPLFFLFFSSHGGPEKQNSRRMAMWSSLPTSVLRSFFFSFFPPCEASNEQCDGLSWISFPFFFFLPPFFFFLFAWRCLQMFGRGKRVSSKSMTSLLLPPLSPFSFFSFFSLFLGRDQFQGPRSTTSEATRAVRLALASSSSFPFFSLSFLPY